MTVRRRLWVLALVLVVVGVAVVGGLVWLTRPTTAPGDETAWEQVLDRIGPEGDVDFETALQAFSVAFGPLPGVPTPPGRQSVVASGTGALRWLQGYRDRLTPEQLVAVDRYLTAKGSTFRLEPDATEFVEVEGELPILAAGMGPAARPQAAGAALVSESEYRRLVALYRGVIGDLLHRKFLFPIDVHVNDEQVGSEYAYTEPDYGLFQPNPVQGCKITINPSLSNDPEPAAQSASMAHEVFHCFQSVLFVGIDAWNSAHGARPWLIEGSAEWVGEVLGGPSHIGLPTWQKYLTTPERRLFSRGYSGVGFFLHMAEQRLDPWAVFDRMFTSSNEVAYRLAIGSPSDAFEDTWASGVWRDKAVGGAWFAQGLWATTVSAPIYHQSVAEGGTEKLDADPFTTEDWEVTTDAKILHVEPQGSVRLGSGPSFDYVARTGLDLCVDGGACVCPAGKHYVGPSFVLVDLPLRVALTGGETGARLAMTGQSLDELCAPDASGSPPPSAGAARPRGGPNPCANGCAGSIGDPHLETIDRQEYDFQAAGEYELLRNADGSMEIQARQAPYPDIADVSINTALAWKVNGHRIGMYAGEDTYVLHVDGAEVDPRTAGTIDLGRGAAVTSLGSGIEVAFPDGTISTAVFHGNGFADALDIQIAPSDAFRAEGVGLLGPIIPGSELPAMPDGSKLQRSADRPTRYAQRYAQLGPAWHVTDQTSLFDYAAGESSSTFDRPGFPSPDVAFDIDELQARVGLAEFQEAAEACAAVQASERERLHCVFDLMATKDPAYVDFYKMLQQFLIEGPTALDEGPTSSPEPTATSTSTLPAGFYNVEPNASVLRGAAIGPDGNVYLSAQRADQAFELLELDPASGTILKSVPTNGGLEVAVAGGSIWLGTNGPTDGTCAIVRFEPGTLVEQATLPVGCSIAPRITATDDAVWWVDISTADANGHGGRLRRIDPASNEIGPGVELPAIYDFILSSHTTVFAGGDLTDPNTYRLGSGDAAFVSMGAVPALAFPAGDGLWTQVIANGQAQPEAAFYSAAGGPQQRVSIDGRLIGADDQAVYAARFGQDGRDELWRYATDGSTTTQVALSTTLQTTSGQMALSYGATGGRFLVGDRWALASWMVYGLTTPNVPALVVQAAPLP